WPDGKSYEGQWKDGKQHGEARFTNSKGKSKYGLWENGDRVKWLDGKSSIKTRSEMSKLESQIEFQSKHNK
ncbi:MAG: hypothetical protein ACK55Z_33295, partial [bacterium]